jgi:cytoskeletal protein CcmA (bactofilin family)
VLVSTDYTFSARVQQDAALADGKLVPLLVSGYDSGRTYSPTVVQNPDGTLTMVFSGYGSPKPLPADGSVLGTGLDGAPTWTVSATDPALYRNILTMTLTPSPQLVTGNVSCANAVYFDSTIQGSVTVPSGDTCTLTSSTIGGNVQVNNGATLVDNGSTINGGLQATDAAAVDIRGAGTIKGNLQIKGTSGTPSASIGDGATANDVCATTIQGNVQIQNNGVGAPFDIGAAPDCNLPLTIGGNLQVQSNAGKMLIGPATNGTGNTAQGNIQVMSNTGGGSLTDNTTAGNCQLRNDVPGIVGAGNSAASQNSCNQSA